MQRHSPLLGTPAPRSAATLLTVPSLLFLFAFLFLPVLLAPAPASAQELLLVGGESGGEVSAVDATCWEVTGSLRVEGGVERVEVSRDGRFGYVAHSLPRPGEGASPGGGGSAGAVVGDGPDSPRGEGDGEGAVGGPGADVRGSAVTTVDLRPLRAVNRASFSATGRATDLWVGNEGGRYWVATEEDGRVFTVEAATGKLLHIWTIGGRSPQHGAVNHRDRWMFVANRDAGTVTVMDRVTIGARTVPVGRNPGALAVAPDSRWAWVVFPDRDRILLVDGRRGEVTDSLSSGGEEPVQIRFSPSGREAWVLNAGSSELTVIDRLTRRPAASVSVPGTPRRFLLSPDGSRAVVTVPDRRALVLVDVPTREVLGSVELPVRPAELAWGRCSGPGCGEDGDGVLFPAPADVETAAVTDFGCGDPPRPVGSAPADAPPRAASVTEEKSGR